MAMTSRQRPDATATDDLGRIRALVEGLPEPALIVGDGVVSIGNARARGLYGSLGWSPSGVVQQCPWPPFPTEVEYVAPAAP